MAQRTLKQVGGVGGLRIVFVKTAQGVCRSHMMICGIQTSFKSYCHSSHRKGRQHNMLTKPAANGRQECLSVWTDVHSVTETIVLVSAYCICPPSIPLSTATLPELEACQQQPSTRNQTLQECGRASMRVNVCLRVCMNRSVFSWVCL